MLLFVILSYITAFYGVFLEHSVKCRSVLQHRRDSFTLIKD
jgi:hypothetical protein